MVKVHCKKLRTQQLFYLFFRLFATSAILVWPNDWSILCWPWSCGMDVRAGTTSTSGKPFGLLAPGRCTSLLLNSFTCLSRVATCFFRFSNISVIFLFFLDSSEFWASSLFICSYRVDIRFSSSILRATAAPSAPRWTRANDLSSFLVLTASLLHFTNYICDIYALTF